jgi:sporadic carbohydrate cluster 2OG-Fe(II) oxygenase
MATTPMSDAMLDEFEARGFVVVPAVDPSTLDRMRASVRDFAYEILGVSSGRIVGDDLDRLHEHVLAGDAANTFRMALTNVMTERLDVGLDVFTAFEPHLAQLVGVDVLVQRAPNVVFQPPGDPRPTELHRDAPANSPYEVVVWLPLVDCAGTKSMYLLDELASREALAFHRAHPDDSEGFQRYLDEVAELMVVPYGSALLFWPGLFHGSLVNREVDSRLSINIRYKNLFAPLGMKDPFRYFRVLRTSPLTRLGLAFERDEG